MSSKATSLYATTIVAAITVGASILTGCSGATPEDTTGNENTALTSYHPATYYGDESWMPEFVEEAANQDVAEIPQNIRDIYTTTNALPPGDDGLAYLTTSPVAAVAKPVSQAWGREIAKKVVVWVAKNPGKVVGGALPAVVGGVWWVKNLTQKQVDAQFQAERQQVLAELKMVEEQIKRAQSVAEFEALQKKADELEKRAANLQQKAGGIKPTQTVAMEEATLDVRF